MTWSAALPGAALRMLRTAAGRRALRVALLVGGVLFIGLVCGERVYAADGVRASANSAAGRSGPADLHVVSGADTVHHVRAMGERGVRAAGVVGQVVSGGRGEARARASTPERSRSPERPSPLTPGRAAPERLESLRLKAPALSELPVRADRPSEAVLSELPVRADRPSEAVLAQVPPPSARPAQPEPPRLPKLPGSPVAPALPKLPVSSALPTRPVLPEPPASPALPELPPLPEVPLPPTLPDMPPLPTVPALPTLPAHPALPTLPDLLNPPVLPDLPNPLDPLDPHPLDPPELPGLPLPPDDGVAVPEEIGSPRLPSRPALPSRPLPVPAAAHPEAGEPTVSPSGVPVPAERSEAAEPAGSGTAAHGVEHRGPRAGQAHQDHEGQPDGVGHAPVEHGPGGRPDGTLGNRALADNSTSRHGDAYAVTLDQRTPLRLVPGAVARSYAAGTRDRHRDVSVFPG